MWSAAEQWTDQGALMDTNGGEFWIGLVASSGHFSWLDGTPFDFDTGETMKPEKKWWKRYNSSCSITEIPNGQNRLNRLKGGKVYFP